MFGTDMGERRGDVRGAWRRACDAAGITNLHMHDLRREFASRLLESGANTALVRDWLGHASLTMTSRYLATTASASKPRGHSSSATPHSAPSHLGQRRGPAWSRRCLPLALAFAMTTRRSVKMPPRLASGQRTTKRAADRDGAFLTAVSYTHLTLPTILRV